MRDFHFPGRSSVLAENGMCATSHPLAAQAALEILKNGGNAMDAAIAGAVLLGICEPQMTGIGGDCFVLFSPSGSNEIKSMNGSGYAPSLANADELRDEALSSIPLNSAHAVTIPCAIDAFCKLSADWGKLGLDTILQPAIHYAEHGVPIAERVAYDLAELTENLNPAGREFYLPWGRAPRVGELFAHPGQVKVLNEIAKKGRDGFYSGEVAEDMVNSLQKLGGTHTMDDFSIWRPSIQILSLESFQSLNSLNIHQMAREPQPFFCVIFSNISPYHQWSPLVLSALTLKLKRLNWLTMHATD